MEDLGLFDDDTFDGLLSAGDLLMVDAPDDTDDIFADLGGVPPSLPAPKASDDMPRVKTEPMDDSYGVPIMAVPAVPQSSLPAPSIPPPSIPPPSIPVVTPFARAPATPATWDTPPVAKMEEPVKQEAPVKQEEEGAELILDDEALVDGDVSTLTKEQKKQRRLLRNRMSAQLHRERKRKHEEDLEGRLKEKCAELEAANNQTLQLRSELAFMKHQLERCCRSCSCGACAGATASAIHSVGSDSDTDATETFSGDSRASFGGRAVSFDGRASFDGSSSSDGSPASTPASSPSISPSRTPDSPPQFASSRVGSALAKTAMLMATALTFTNLATDQSAPQAAAAAAALAGGSQLMPTVRHGGRVLQSFADMPSELPASQLLIDGPGPAAGEVSKPTHYHTQYTADPKYAHTSEYTRAEYTNTAASSPGTSSRALTKWRQLQATGFGFVEAGSTPAESGPAPTKEAPAPPARTTGAISHSMRLRGGKNHHQASNPRDEYDNEYQRGYADAQQFFRDQAYADQKFRSGTWEAGAGEREHGKADGFMFCSDAYGVMSGWAPGGPVGADEPDPRATPTMPTTMPATRGRQVARDTHARDHSRAVVGAGANASADSRAAMRLLDAGLTGHGAPLLLGDGATTEHALAHIGAGGGAPSYSSGAGYGGGPSSAGGGGSDGKNPYMLLLVPSDSVNWGGGTAASGGNSTEDASDDPADKAWVEIGCSVLHANVIKSPPQWQYAL